MRILLVKPHPELLVSRSLQEGFLHLEPLELEIVAGGVPRSEEVKILDLSLKRRNPFLIFKNTLKEWKPDLIGFSGYSTNVSVIKRLAVLAKETSPQVIIMVGGIHATLLPQDYAVAGIDLIVRGEGGTLLSELIRRYKNKEALFFGDAVLSPSDPEFNSKAILPPPKYPEASEIPLPRRDLVERKRYFCVWTSSDTNRLDSLFPQVASMRTSVGCAFSCSFCVIPHLMHGRYIKRAPSDVVNEIARLGENYIYFLDDEMFIDVERCKKIAELLIERGIHKKYISWARSDTIVKNPEVFKLWKEAGLSTLYVGLESMDEARLTEYKKRLGAKTNRKAIEILKKLDITFHAAFIVHPDFSTDDFRRLEKEVLALCPAEVTFTVLSPSPGTPYWHENKDKFICDPYKYYDCMHTILPTKLSLRRFYQHFARLTNLALRANPLRVNKIRVPLKDFLRAIHAGTKYIISLQLIYKDYFSKENAKYS